MDRSELEEISEEWQRAFAEVVEALAKRERRYPTGAAAGFAIVAVVAGLVGFALGRLL